jgi:hypothetical protein
MTSRNGAKKETASEVSPDHPQEKTGGWLEIQAMKARMRSHLRFGVRRHKLVMRAPEVLQEGPEPAFAPLHALRWLSLLPSVETLIAGDASSCSRRPASFGSPGLRLLHFFLT